MDKSVIKNFAVACAAETAIASVFTLGTAFFCGVDLRVAIVAAGVFVVAKNVAYRGLKFLVNWRASRIEGFEKKVWGLVSKVLTSFSVMNLVGLDRITRNVLVHEFGHVAVGKTVFSNAKYVVEVTGMQTGVTKMMPKGNKPIMGFKYSKPMMAAGGPLFALIGACGMIALAHFYGEAYEGFGAFLYGAALMSLIQHIQYAISAVGKMCVAGHDFGVMASFGIDPRLWIAAFVLVPTALFGALKLYAFLTKPSLKTVPSLPMARLPVK